MEVTRAQAFRLSVLMTHYRHPLDHTEKRMNECKTILERWFKAMVVCDDHCPLDVLKCFGEDCNTPKMVSLLHVYRKTDGKKLYASLKFLGIFDGVCEPDEIKTLPDDLVSPGPLEQGNA